MHATLFGTAATCCYYYFHGHGIVMRQTRHTWHTVPSMLVVVVDDGVLALVVVVLHTVALLVLALVV